MDKMLVLVRHAKAEGHAQDDDDLLRSLTEAGRRSCEMALPRALDLLKLDEAAACGVRVWSSPALRARQTADIAASALGCEVELVDALWDGSVSDVLAQFEASACSVVCVGHNPQLEDLFAQLTGCHCDFGKGAATAFAWNGEGYRLAWFVQGPDWTRWKTLTKMEKACAKAGRNISARAWEFLDEPDDVEALHQYRISLRVARSLVDFLAPCQRGKESRRLARDLKRLQGCTSRLRELDIMHECLSAERISCPDLAELDGLVCKMRDDECDSLVAYLDSDAGRACLRGVVATLKNVSWRDRLNAHGIDAAVLGERYDMLYASYSAQLVTCDFTDAEATHDVRKRSKQLRYIARELGDVFSGERASEERAAREVQDMLGELCDCRVNLDLFVQLGADPAAPFARAQERRITELLVELGAVGGAEPDQGGEQTLDAQVQEQDEPSAQDEGPVEPDECYTLAH